MGIATALPGPSRGRRSSSTKITSSHGQSMSLHLPTHSPSMNSDDAIIREKDTKKQTKRGLKASMMQDPLLSNDWCGPADEWPSDAEIHAKHEAPHLFHMHKMWTAPPKGLVPALRHQRVNDPQLELVGATVLIDAEPDMPVSDDPQLPSLIQEHEACIRRPVVSSAFMRWMLATSGSAQKAYGVTQVHSLPAIDSGPDLTAPRLSVSQTKGSTTSPWQSVQSPKVKQESIIRTRRNKQAEERAVRQGQVSSLAANGTGESNAISFSPRGQKYSRGREIAGSEDHHTNVISQLGSPASVSCTPRTRRSPNVLSKNSASIMKDTKMKSFSPTREGRRGSSRLPQQTQPRTAIGSSSAIGLKSLADPNQTCESPAQQQNTARDSPQSDENKDLPSLYFTHGGFFEQFPLGSHPRGVRVDPVHLGPEVSSQSTVECSCSSVDNASGVNSSETMSTVVMLKKDAKVCTVQMQINVNKAKQYYKDFFENGGTLQGIPDKSLRQLIEEGRSLPSGFSSCIRRHPMPSIWNGIKQAALVPAPSAQKINSERFPSTDSGLARVKHMADAIRIDGPVLCSNGELYADCESADLELAFLQELLRRQVARNAEIRMAVANRLEKGIAEEPNRERRLNAVHAIERIILADTLRHRLIDRLKTGLKDRVQGQHLSGDPEPGQDDESVCMVCFNGESLDDNQILFCDGCNVAVHQCCYGVREIPEDEWYCRCCRMGIRNQPSCEICRQDGGGPLCRLLYSGGWVHTHCALTTPGVSFDSVLSLNGVILPEQRLLRVPQISVPSPSQAMGEASGGSKCFSAKEGCTQPRRRSRQLPAAAVSDDSAYSSQFPKCQLCKMMGGYCTTCSGGCGKVFHTLCAWLSGFQLRIHGCSPSAGSSPSRFHSPVAVQYFCSNCQTDESRNLRHNRTVRNNFAKELIKGPRGKRKLPPSAKQSGRSTKTVKIGRGDREIKVVTAKEQISLNSFIPKIPEISSTVTLQALVDDEIQSFLLHCQQLCDLVKRREEIKLNMVKYYGAVIEQACFSSNSRLQSQYYSSHEMLSEWESARLLFEGCSWDESLPTYKPVSGPWHNGQEAWLLKMKLEQIPRVTICLNKTAKKRGFSSWWEMCDNCQDGSSDASSDASKNQSERGEESLERSPQSTEKLQTGSSTPTFPVAKSRKSGGGVCPQQ